MAYTFRQSLFIIVLVFSCFFSAGSQANTENFVVRTALKSCGGDSTLRESTGILFREGGRTFAMTSYFLSLGEVGPHCIQVTFKGKKYPAQIAASDWSRDLILLELPALSEELPLLAELTQATSSEKVFLTALPRGKDYPSVSEFALLTAKSTRFSIPTYTNAIELQGTELDSGAVGGFVSDGAGHWVGMVSREYLKLTPGSATHPTEWTGISGEEANHLIVLPAQSLSSWALGKIHGFSKENPLAVESVTEKGKSLFSSGPLRFGLVCPSPDDPESPLGPIGGSEGVGIGGESNSIPFCKANLTLESLTQTPWPFPARLPWVNSLLPSLNGSGKFRVRYFVQRKSTGQLVRVPFWTIGGLFRGFSNPALTSITWHDTNSIPAELTPQWKRIRGLAKQGLPIVMDLYKVEIFSAGVPSLLREVYFQLQVLSSEEAPQISMKRDLAPLAGEKGPHQWEWQILSKAGHGGEVSELLKILGMLTQELSR